MKFMNGYYHRHWITIFITMPLSLGMGRIMLFRVLTDNGYPVIFLPDISFLILPLSGRIVRFFVEK